MNNDEMNEGVNHDKEIKYDEDNVVNKIVRTNTNKTTTRIQKCVNMVNVFIKKPEKKTYFEEELNKEEMEVLT